MPKGMKDLDMTALDRIIKNTQKSNTDAGKALLKDARSERVKRMMNR